MRLKTIELSVNRQYLTEELRSLRDRLNEMDLLTNNSLPTIRVMIENIQERLQGIEAGAHRQPRTTHPKEDEQQVPNRNDHLSYMDQSDEEAI